MNSNIPGQSFVSINGNVIIAMYLKIIPVCLLSWFKKVECFYFAAQNAFNAVKILLHDEYKSELVRNVM